MLAPERRTKSSVRLNCHVESIGGPLSTSDDVRGTSVDGSDVRPSEPHVRILNVIGPSSTLPLPSPLAAATFVVPAADFRVLDAAGVHFEVIGQARRMRPAAVAVRVRGASSSDEFRLFVDGQVTEPLRVDAQGDGVVAHFDLGAPASEDVGTQSLRFHHAGVRDGRAGHVVVHAKLERGPLPRVVASPKLARGPMARALALQGFDVVARPATAMAGDRDASLYLTQLSEAPSPDVVAHIDAGAGAILVASDASEAPAVDPAWEALLPIVGAKVEERAPEGNDDEGEGATGVDVGVDGARADAKPDAASQSRASDGLRRTGAVSEAEAQTASAPGSSVATRSIALVLLVDVSGSMSGPVEAPAIHEAKRAAKASAEALGSDDSFALITFGSEAQVVLALGKASRRDDLILALGRLRAEASATRAYLALQAAWAELKRSDAAVRHVLLLTDGEFTDSALDYLQLVRAMRLEGIGLTAIASTTSSVSGLEAGKFRFLQRLLASVDGRLQITTSKEIARLVLGEVREVVGAARPLAAGGGQASAAANQEAKPADDESQEPRTEPKVSPPEDEASKPDLEPRAAEPAPKFDLRVIEAAPLLDDVEAGQDFDWPRLRGAKPVEARERARVHLAFAESGKLALATTRYGLGLVAVWASDDGTRWAQDFASDPRFPGFVARLAAWAEGNAPSGVADDRETTHSRGRVVVTGRQVIEGDGITREELSAIAEAASGRVLGSLVEARAAAPTSLDVTGDLTRSPLWRLAALLACAVAMVVVEWSSARTKR